jgi:hypothetical protein
MKKKKVFRYAAFCFTLLFLMVPDVSAEWGDMEVLEYSFDIGATPRSQWYPHLDINPIDNEFMVVWRTSGILRDDCDPGDEYECSNSFQTLDGQRVSPYGALLGDSLQWSPAELGLKMIPRIAHNVFTNEYIIGFSKGTSYAETEIYISRVGSAGNILSGTERLYEGEGAAHMYIIFNPLRQEYLVMYNNRNIFNEYQNNVGFILNEDGRPIHGPFPVGNQEGDFYAPYGAHNPTNDTYFVVWEDFRNVSDWMYDPCDVYGALLDADGNMIAEIPVMDDYDTPNVADQRVPVPCYNPDKNEFLVAWRDDRPPLDNYGIMGRIVGPDGTLKGSEFVMLDPPGMQGTIEMHYLEEEKKYFSVWTDTRNASDPGLYYFLSDEADIYGRWLDDTGKPIGDEITICDEPNVQMHPEMAYNPVMKRFLITWYDWNAPNDYGVLEEIVHIGSDVPADVRGTIYGIPSFLSGRVVEKGTANPIEGAWTLVIGPSLPSLKKTNVGGWFNIKKNSQSTGTYRIIAFKLGYGMATQTVNYEGVPLKETIELGK